MMQHKIRQDYNHYGTTSMNEISPGTVWSGRCVTVTRHVQLARGKLSKSKECLQNFTQCSQKICNIYELLHRSTPITEPSHLTKCSKVTYNHTVFASGFVLQFKHLCHQLFKHVNIIIDQHLHYKHIWSSGN